MTTDTLRSLDVAIDTAVSDRDAAVLDSLLADDYIYTHSNGRSQSKREYIDGIAGRDNPPRRLLSDIQVELHDDIAVSRGKLAPVTDGRRPYLLQLYDY